MKLSIEWLSQYMDMPKVSPEDVAHQLTMKTAEVEEVETLNSVVDGIVVGEVMDVEPVEHAGGTALNLVTVDTGDRTYQTVCGAPNAEVGMKSAFAPPGTAIAGGMVIAEQTIAGRKSSGILCSAQELGWGDFHLGIMAFPQSLEAGMLIADMVPATDYLIEIDNKSVTHRPDLWGHYGFARELAAIYGCELKPLGMIDEAEGAGLDPFPLRIEDSDGCPGYCCLDIDGLKPGYAPVWMQYRLLAIGQRPINLLVDLTNFIMFELGQPMHAFDGDLVRDIVVSKFGAEGTFQTLDSIYRDMLPDDCMICDHNGPIALAGIMGGEETEVKEHTTRLLLESANFNPARIRRTALRLDLRSEASQRFEKGQPPYHMEISIRRFVRLLRDAGLDAVLKSRLTCAGDTGAERRTIRMSASALNRAIGMDIPRDRIEKILSDLEFTCSFDGDEMVVTVPQHRSKRDISIPEDIVEEVARIYGYDNIEPAMPTIRMQPYVFNRKHQRLQKIRRFLSVGRSFLEVHLYSWYDDNWLRRIGYDPGETMRLKNPAAENNSRMRLELLPNLLALVEQNAVHRDRFLLYEIDDVYHKRDKELVQPLHLAGIAYQSEKLGKVDSLFREIKGLIEDIALEVNTGSVAFLPLESVGKPWQDKYATLAIHIGGAYVGSMGYLVRPFLDVFDKGTQVVWFELDVDALDGATFPDHAYKPIPVYPGSWMDFSILAPGGMRFSELVSFVDSFEHPCLRNVKYLYLYDGKGLPDNTICYTFRFWLGLDERTLTGDDINDFRDRFIASLQMNNLSLR